MAFLIITRLLKVDYYQFAPFPLLNFVLFLQNDDVVTKLLKHEVGEIV